MPEVVTDRSGQCIPRGNAVKEPQGDHWEPVSESDNGEGFFSVIYTYAYTTNTGTTMDARPIVFSDVDLRIPGQLCVRQHATAALVALEKSLGDVPRRDSGL